MVQDEDFVLLSGLGFCDKLQNSKLRTWDKNTKNT